MKLTFVSCELFWSLMNFVIVGNVRIYYPGSDVYCNSIVLHPSFSNWIIYSCGINVILNLLLNDSAIAKKTKQPKQHHKHRQLALCVKNKVKTKWNKYSTIFVFLWMTLLGIIHGSNFDESIRKWLGCLVVMCVHRSNYCQES